MVVMQALVAATRCLFAAALSASRLTFCGLGQAAAHKSIKTLQAHEAKLRAKLDQAEADLNTRQAVCCCSNRYNGRYLGHVRLKITNSARFALQMPPRYTWRSVTT